MEKVTLNKFIQHEIQKLLEFRKDYKNSHEKDSMIFPLELTNEEWKEVLSIYNCKEVEY